MQKKKEKGVTRECTCEGQFPPQKKRKKKRKKELQHFQRAAAVVNGEMFTLAGKTKSARRQQHGGENLKLGMLEDSWCVRKCKAVALANVLDWQCWPENRRASRKQFQRQMAAHGLQSVAYWCEYSYKTDCTPTLPPTAFLFHARPGHSRQTCCTSHLCKVMANEREREREQCHNNTDPEPNHIQSTTRG